MASAQTTNVPDARRPHGSNMLETTLRDDATGVEPPVRPSKSGHDEHGFRHTKPSHAHAERQGTAPTAAATTPETQAHRDPPITSEVIEGLTHGQTPRMIADRLDLPIDFIELVISQERSAGRLDVYDLRSCNSTTGQGCDPDPESLVCASCPILPAAIRRRQSLAARLRSKLHKRI
jgi:hypothetical protein